MIQTIVSKLIDTIPKKIKTNFEFNPLIIDIVLEGGAFNGSYLAGCLFYLKELEERNYIKINRLSACSVGTIISLVYFINNEILMTKIYELSYNQFKKKADINIFKKAFQIIKTYITPEIFDSINNRLYISYFNVDSGKQKVVCKYKDIDHLLDIIRRSCSFPYIIDKNLYYKNKYVDGMYPYIFSIDEKNIQNKHILYLNLHSIHHVTGLMSVKNEPNNIKRVVDGVISTHNFFVYKKNTDICSFVDEWSVKEYFTHYLFTIYLSVFIYVLHKIYILENILRKKFKINKISLINIINYFYNWIIKQYCI